MIGPGCENYSPIDHATTGYPLPLPPPPSACLAGVKSNYNYIRAPSKKLKLCDAAKTKERDVCVCECVRGCVRVCALLLDMYKCVGRRSWGNAK